MIDDLIVRLQETKSAFEACTAAVKSPFPRAALGALQASLLPGVISRNNEFLAAHRNDPKYNPDSIRALIDATAQLQAIREIPAGTTENLVDALARIGKELPNPNATLGLGLGLIIALVVLVIVLR